MCSGCNNPLLPILSPQLPKTEDGKPAMVELYSLSNEAELALMKSILEVDDIYDFVRINFWVVWKLALRLHYLIRRQ